MIKDVVVHERCSGLRYVHFRGDCGRPIQWPETAVWECRWISFTLWHSLRSEWREASLANFGPMARSSLKRGGIARRFGQVFAVVFGMFSCRFWPARFVPCPSICVSHEDCVMAPPSDNGTAVCSGPTRHRGSPVQASAWQRGGVQFLNHESRVVVYMARHAVNGSQSGRIYFTVFDARLLRFPSRAVRSYTARWHS
jgi:hypothetical protein